MPAKSLNLDVEVLGWLERTAEAERKSASAVVNEILRAYVQEVGGKRHGRK